MTDMTLTNEAREALKLAINPAVKWGDHGRTVVARMHDDEGLDLMMETLVPAVERILAAREKALREEIAADLKSQAVARFDQYGPSDARGAAFWDSAEYVRGETR